MSAELEITLLTEKLIHYNRQFFAHFKVGRESGVNYDFHEQIKPFVEEVGKVNKKWKMLMGEWVRKHNPKHIHLKRVETISEQIEQISIQSFFPETSKTRFINTHRSIEFFLDELLLNLTNRKEMH